MVLNREKRSFSRMMFDVCRLERIEQTVGWSTRRYLTTHSVSLIRMRGEI